MSGPGAVVAVVLLEWTTGLVAGAAWTQSWGVVRRGHFRIAAWTGLILAGLALVAARAADPHFEGMAWSLAIATASGLGAYLAMQYVRTDLPGAVVGLAVAGLGGGALVAAATSLDGWNAALAALELIAGAAILGGVTNGMLLGHWYLNQPGLKPWALARLTTGTLLATAATLVLGVAAAGRLTNASTSGSVLGLPGAGETFGVVFFIIWAALVLFTGGVVWAARRCVNIRSIQSATGLYYVALLTAGVAEFLVRYLMINAS